MDDRDREYAAVASLAQSLVPLGRASRALAQPQVLTLDVFWPNTNIPAIVSFCSTALLPGWTHMASVST
jgi:hypothetical protein